MDLFSLKIGDRVRTSKGGTAEILSETEDGRWIRLRYIQSGDEELVGTEDLCEADEIEARLD